MRYKTITPLHRDENFIPVPPSSNIWSYHGQINHAAPEYPIGEERVIPNFPIERWRTPKVKHHKSWKKVKDEGIIKMTPYSVGFRSKEEYIIEREHWRNNFTRDYLVENRCPTVAEWYPTTSLETRWLQKYDLRDFSGLPVVSNNFDLADEIAKVKNECKSSVVSSQFHNLDVLTSVAELPKTLDLLVTVFQRARHPLEGIASLLKRYRKAHGNKDRISTLHKDFLSEWMQYRYGIMPLVYTIKDVLEILDGMKYEFRTDKDKGRVILPAWPSALPNEDCLIQAISGDVTIRAVGKSSYLNPNLRLSDQLTINPFYTAWELIPLSFVIDWFVNVGDWLLAETAGMRDLASQRSFCISTKINIEETITLKKRWIDGGISEPPAPFNHWGSCDGRDLTYTDTVRYDTLKVDEQMHLLSKTVEKSYVREIFVPADVELQFNPHLNWKRWMDAYALTFNRALKGLRKLK